jgi:hypothetical protein
MKIRLKFGYFDGTDESLEVDWAGANPKDFPLISFYKDRYWSFIFHSNAVIGVEHELQLSETKKSALPYDLFGNPFPATNLVEMFNLKTVEDGPCECGAKFTDFPENHMIMCKRWRKP